MDLLFYDLLLLADNCKQDTGFAPQFRTKVARGEFELKGVGDCALVYGYFIFIEC